MVTACCFAAVTASSNISQNCLGVGFPLGKGAPGINLLMSHNLAALHPTTVAAEHGGQYMFGG